MLGLKDNFQAGKILETERRSLEEIGSDALMDVWAHWNEKRGDAFAPSLRTFSIDELPPRIIPYMTLVDFLGARPDIHYRFFGSRMVEIVGREMTGKTLVMDGVVEYGAMNAKVFPDVISEKRPICTRTKWVSGRDLHFDTVTIRLPLSDNGTDVTSGVMALQFTDKSAERDSLTR